MDKPYQITILKPNGFCYGVLRAIKMATEIDPLATNGPIYLLGAIVHNQRVNEQLLKRGYTLLTGSSRLEMLSKVDSGTIVISAHGANQEVYKIAKEKNLTIVDTTCPHVRKSMERVISYLDQGYQVIFVGRKNHPEVEALTNISNRLHFLYVNDFHHFNDFNHENLFYPPLLPSSQHPVVITSQTTITTQELNRYYHQLKKVIPDLLILDDVCHITSQRQQCLLKAINNHLQSTDTLFLIVGDSKSRNTLELVNLVKSHHLPVLLIDDPFKITELNLTNYRYFYLTSGTSSSSQDVDLTYQILNDHLNIKKDL